MLAHGYKLILYRHAARDVQLRRARIEVGAEDLYREGDMVAFRGDGTGGSGGGDFADGGRAEEIVGLDQIVRMPLSTSQSLWWKNKSFLYRFTYLPCLRAPLEEELLFQCHRGRRCSS